MVTNLRPRSYASTGDQRNPSLCRISLQGVDCSMLPITSMSTLEVTTMHVQTTPVKMNVKPQQNIESVLEEMEGRILTGATRHAPVS